MFPSSYSVTELYFFLFKFSFVLNIIIAFLCKHSSISSIIDAERNYNYSLNAIISLLPTPYLHSVNRMLYI